MADYKYFENFKLTDRETKTIRTLRDFGGTVYNPNSEGIDVNLLPEPNHITDKNDNLDGERYIKTVYGTRLIEIPVVFSQKYGGGNLFELNQWLSKKHQQVFEWVDDEEHKEIDVIYQKGFDINVLYGKEFYGLTTLSFIAHNPYWRIKNEQPLIYMNLVSGNVLNIKNKGNTDCYPLLKITPNGTQTIIKIQWNDILIVLNNIDKPFYIDCEQQRCYEVVNGENKISLKKFVTDKYYTFPQLYVDKRNIIKIIEGSIKEFNMKFNTRII